MRRVKCFCQCYVTHFLFKSWIAFTPERYPRSSEESNLLTAHIECLIIDNRYSNDQYIDIANFTLLMKCLCRFFYQVGLHPGFDNMKANVCRMCSSFAMNNIAVDLRQTHFSGPVLFILFPQLQSIFSTQHPLVKHIYIYIYIYTTGKKYGIFFISTNFFIFVQCAGCFCTWNTFLRADITFGGVNLHVTAKWRAMVQKQLCLYFSQLDFG